MLGILKIISRFSSNKSKRNTVPRILRDGRYTNKGIRQRKKKEYKYDLTQPYIKNPELYYDYKVDPELSRQKRLAIQQKNDPYDLIEDATKPRDPKVMLSELTDKHLLQTASPRIVNNILIFEKHFPEIIQKNLDVIQYSLQMISKKVHLIGLGDYGILLCLCYRYLGEDRTTWKNLIDVLVKFIEEKCYYQNQIVENEKIQSNLIYALNYVYQASQKFQFDMRDLEDTLKKYFLKNCDKIKNLDNKTLLIATIGKIIENDQDRYIFLKKNSLKLFADLDKMSNKSLNSLTLAINKNKMKISKEQFDKIQECFMNKSKQSAEGAESDQITIFAMFFIQIANIGKVLSFECKAEFKQFGIQFFEKNKNKIIKVSDVAMLAEGFKKMDILNKEFMNFLEPRIQQNMDSINPYQSIQLLRACTKSIKFSEPVVEGIIKNFDLKFGGIRDQDKQKCAHVLKKFETTFNFAQLKNYNQIFDNYNQQQQLLTPKLKYVQV